MISVPHGVRHVADVAFADARDGLLVAGDSQDDQTLYVTHDGGASWASIAPPRRRAGSSFAIAPGVVADADGRALSVTTDEGASWQRLGRSSFYDECEVSRPTTPDIWIACSDFHHTTLFRSGDGGQTWTRHVTPRDIALRVSPTGGPDAWATRLRPYGFDVPKSTLWHTTDGGATWTQAWVSLPPGAPAREVDCTSTPSGVLHVPRAGCR